MNSGQNQKLQIDYSISFEDVSKLFSLPLSEAADILGVSTSVLKKICYENGLVRWPHRKYLAGKSIEEIKKEAAKEKSKAFGGIPPQSNSTNTTSPPGFNAHDKSPESGPEMLKSQGTLQTGSKTTSSGWPHNVAASSLVFEANAFSDEFKYGFPSNGLSEYSYRWWGSNDDSNDGISKNDKKTNSEAENTSKVKTDDSVSSTREGKTDKMEEDSESDKQDGVLLSVIRKRAVEEGKKSKKLNVLTNYGAGKLGNEENILLRKLYQTS